MWVAWEVAGPQVVAVVVEGVPAATVEAASQLDQPVQSGVGGTRKKQQ